MKNLIPYIAFTFLTGFSILSPITVTAGGCSSNMNKTAEIKCSDEDIDCQTDKAEKFDFKKTVKS